MATVFDFPFLLASFPFSELFASPSPVVFLFFQVPTLFVGVVLVRSLERFQASVSFVSLFWPVGGVRGLCGHSSGFVLLHEPSSVTFCCYLSVSICLRPLVFPFFAFPWWVLRGLLFNFFVGGPLPLPLPLGLPLDPLPLLRVLLVERGMGIAAR